MASDVATKYLFKVPTTRKKATPKVIPDHIGQLQADVMYLVVYGVWTGGYKYCLNVIDAYSRFCWSFPVKKLRKADVKKYLIHVIDELIDVYGVDKDKINLTTDQGVEFYHQAGEFEAEDPTLFDVALPVPHTVIKPAMGKGRTVLVERLNRTLHGMLAKKRFVDPHNRSGEVFVEYLNECVRVYNNKMHSTLKATPYQVLTKSVLPEVVEQNDVPTFDVGDAVLVVKKLGDYDKRSAAIRWHPELWRVTGQIGWRYTLKLWGGDEDFDDRYGYIPLGSELQLVKPEDVESYLAYEEPKRVVQQMDDERAEMMKERRMKTLQKQISYRSKTQKEYMTPSSSKRKRPDYKDMDL